MFKRNNALFCILSFILENVSWKFNINSFIAISPHFDCIKVSTYFYKCWREMLQINNYFSLIFIQRNNRSSQYCVWQIKKKLKQHCVNFKYSGFFTTWGWEKEIFRLCVKKTASKLSGRKIIDLKDSFRWHIIYKIGWEILQVQCEACLRNHNRNSRVYHNS